MNLRFALAYAARSLRRDRQRSWLALGCVAMGVMSLVGLRQLSSIVSDVMLLSPRIKQSADLILRRDDPITSGDVATLRQLGVPSLTPIARSQAMLMKTPASGRTTLVSRALGVDPATYPLYGAILLRDGIAWEEALAGVGQAAITSDLARRLSLERGDRFLLFGAPDAPPVELTVGGIIRQAPDRHGMSVVFSLETARAKSLGGITQVHVRDDDLDALTALLETGGWKVERVPVVGGDDVARVFDLMLSGAGLLGLLLGGIGVANTMQVVLARRRQEIATLKALGYQRHHLLMLFGTETVLLGMAGSAIGVGLGLIVANALMHLLSANMAFLLRYDVDALTVVSGLLVGVATTVVFGLGAIVQASDVRPSILLRETSAPTRRGRGTAAALYAALLGMFAVLASAVLGSVTKGFGVVAGGLAVLALLSLLLAGVLLAVVRIPVGRIPLLALARRNLRYQPLRSIYGLVALFVGVIAIGLATIVLHDANLRFESRRPNLAGINLRVYATTNEEASLVRALGATRSTDFHVDAFTRAQVVADTLRTTVQLVGRAAGDLRWNLSLADSAQVAGTPAYAMDEDATRHGWTVGQILTLRSDRGEVDVELAGIFGREGSTLDLAAPPRGLIVPVEVVRVLGPASLPLQVHVAADPDRLAAVSEALGRAVPTGVVIGKDTIADALNRLFEGLFWFAVAVAALALVAGAMLIANAVGLSMLERKRELGVLKAVGYSSRQVLGTIVLENALAGLIGGAMGVLGLTVLVPLVNASAPAAELSFHPAQAALLVLVAVLCAVGASVVVAWRPSRARPLTVLREG